MVIRGNCKARQNLPIQKTLSCFCVRVGSNEPPFGCELPTPTVFGFEKWYACFFDVFSCWSPAIDTSCNHMMISVRCDANTELLTGNATKTDAFAVASRLSVRYHTAFLRFRNIGFVRFNKHVQSFSAVQGLFHEDQQLVVHVESCRTADADDPRSFLQGIQPERGFQGYAADAREK